jgi:hypothetical protein
MAFPIAMYTTGTFRLAEALHLDFLMTVPRVFVWIALLIWLIVFAGMVSQLARTWRSKLLEFRAASHGAYASAARKSRAIGDRSE